MTTELKLILFIVASVGIVRVSRSSLRHYRSHGFPRFFAWEGILGLFFLNVNAWFQKPFSFPQLCSWIFLTLSLLLVLLGARQLVKQGQQDRSRTDTVLMDFEKTTTLVTVGIYRYIRHPLYGSLLFLTWGIFLKQITGIGLLLTALVTVLLILTARREEVENIDYFGAAYSAYMNETKMFIPYLF